MAQSNLYDHYFTASDVNIYLRYPLTDRRVLVDKALGIGFNHSMSSAPVYVLGISDPAFFTRGNSLIQGNLDLAFKSTTYLQKGIRYLLNQDGLASEKKALMAKASTKAKLTPEEVRRLATLQISGITSMETTSISQIFSLFEIIIEFNNTNATTDGEQSTLTIEGVKFTSQGMSVYSTEESSLVDRYTFLAKNKR